MSDAPNEGREEKPVKALFGLEAQGHIDTIERILNEHNWSNDWIWSLIGKEIGWAPSTACAFYVTHLRDQLSKEREKVQSLERWKKEEMEVWGPVLDYMQDGGSGKRGPIGSSISELVLRILKHHYEGKERETIKEKNAWIAEERTINKELAAENRKLESELIEEREIRKELVDCLKECRGIANHYGMILTTKKIELLVKKASELDKNQ